MSTTTNNAYMTKSMNGIISYDDGAGGSMEGGVITCNTLATPNLSADSLQAYTPGASCQLYTDASASDIHIGNSGITLFVDSGIASVSPIYCSELHSANVYASTSVNTTFLDTPLTTDTPYIFPFVTGAITIGSVTAPIIGTRVCTNNNELANKQYVDSIIPSSLLPLTNTWTGTSNTFDNKIVVTSIEAPATFTNVSLFPNITTSSINIGAGITNGQLNLGDNMSAGNINIGATSIATGNTTILIGNDGSGASNSVSLRTLGTLNLGVKATTINIGTTTTAGQINIGTALTTGGAITMGGVAQTGAINIRTAGALNMGVVSSAISIGTTSCPSISIGNTSTTSLTLNTPINPNYDTKYTATGTPTGCIGYILGATTLAAGASLVSGTTKVMCTFTNLPIGVWLLYWNQGYNVTTNTVLTGYINMSMGTTSGGTDILLSIVDCATKTLLTTTAPDYTITQIFSNTLATTDVYFSTTVTFSSGAIGTQTNTITSCKAVRLA